MVVKKKVNSVKKKTGPGKLPEFIKEYKKEIYPYFLDVIYYFYNTLHYKKYRIPKHQYEVLKEIRKLVDLNLKKMEKDYKIKKK